MAPRDIPVANVDITSPFWAEIQRCAREKTIPAIVEAQKSSEHWYCLKWKEGHSIKPHPFWDSDIYKITEAACYFLMKYPDDKMMAVVEDAASMIQNAQHEDGYINSYFTVHGIQRRWTNLRDLHELYCLGHLIEATVAYETLTRSGKLLKVVMKALAHVDSVFGVEEGKKRGYPGHQEIEIGLLRLYELTKEPLTLKLATYFIQERGQRDENDEIYFDREAKARGGDPYEHMGTETKPWYHEPRDYGYHQAACPIIEQSEVVGHSVRAMYFYTAVTDLVRVRGQADEYSIKAKHSLDNLWRDMVDKKMYVTGGLGSVTQWEGFGPPYILPDLEKEGCYSETCATFALIFWCQRMLRLQLKGEYADVMEIGLYNAFLGALSTSGDAFYYQNVLRTMSGEKKERSKWFGVACCPPNVAKLLGQMGSLIYSYDAEKTLVAVNLYIQSDFEIPDTNLKISMATNMPWSGEVTIKVSGGAVGIALRIPTWLYGAKYNCSIQGELKDGYLYLPPSDYSEITLSLPMTPHKIYANPKTNKDEMCIMRGPLVYCIEDVDNEGVDVDNLGLLDGSIKEQPHRNIESVSDVVPVVVQGRQLKKQRSESLYGTRPWEYDTEVKDIVAVPYFLRSNRGGNGAMRVWAKRLDGSTNKN